MRYLATVTLVIVDEHPSPDAMASILAHLLLGEGVTSVHCVTLESDDESLYQATAKAVKSLPAQSLSQGGGRRDRGQSGTGARP